MKMILKTLVPVLLLSALAQVSAFGQGRAAAATAATGDLSRVATVDLSRVFTNYWRTKEADTFLQDRRAEMAKSEKELMDNIQKAQEEYKRLDADARDQAVAAEEREKRKKATVDKLKEIDDLKSDFEKFERQARADLSERYMRLRDNLLGEIRGVINSRAKGAGFMLVLDAAAQTADRTPIVLYSTTEDLTEPVLKQLNDSKPIEPRESKPPASDKSEPKPEKK
jgi:outer membrane protein